MYVCIYFNFCSLYTYQYLSNHFLDLFIQCDALVLQSSLRESILLLCHRQIFILDALFSIFTSLYITNPGAILSVFLVKYDKKHYYIFIYSVLSNSQSIFSQHFTHEV